MKAPDYPITNSTLRRRTSLPKATAPMKRTRLKARGKRRFKGTDCPEFREWIKTQRCVVTGRHGNIDPAHLPKSKAQGAPDLGGIVPLWHVLHDEQHQHGLPAFLKKYGLTSEGLHALGALYADEWRRLFPELAAKYELPTPGAPPSPTGEQT